MSLPPRSASGPLVSTRRRPLLPASSALLASSLALLVLVLSGCASSGSSIASTRAESDSELDQPMLMIALQDYGTARRFELVNPAHTDPVEYYSAKRDGAGRKIVASEIVAALIEYMDENGMGEYASAGRLPFGHSGVTRGIEVRGPGGTLHWAPTAGASAAERRAMVECTKTFLETFNLVTAYQTIDNDDGSAFFQNAAAEARATGGR